MNGWEKRELYVSGEIATDEGDGEGRMVWGREGVASVLREERKTLCGQAGKGDDENEQRDGEKLVLEIQTRMSDIRTNSNRLRGGLDKVPSSISMGPFAFSLETEEYVSFKMQTYVLKFK